MVRGARLFMLALVLCMLSCRDAGVTAPEAGSAETIEAQHAAKPDPADEVGDLDRVARYSTPPGVRGVERATAVIGAAGGSVRLRDFEVVVPAGAVSGDVTFEITILPEPARQAHAWASFKPHNQQFAVPITLRVPYQTTESAGAADAHVLWRNKGMWEELPTTITTDGRLETQTDHFSVYATQRRGITMVGG